MPDPALGTIVRANPVTEGQQGNRPAVVPGLGIWTGKPIMELLLFCLLILAIFLFTRAARAVSRRQRAMEQALETLPDFSPTQTLLGSDGMSGLAFDEDTKKICLIKDASGTIELHPIGNRDVLSAELLVDGDPVTRTERTSRSGGTLTGDLAPGSAGAVIGGLSEKKGSPRIAKRVDLRLIIKDTRRPIHEINVLDGEVKRDKAVYQNAIYRARLWHGLLTILIEDADSADTAGSASARPGDQNGQANESVADEIRKLGLLRDEGLLTETEFTAQKRKLLG